MFLLPLSLSGNQLKGVFSYSSTSFSPDGYSGPSENILEPAFFIFDTEKQEITIFNFLDLSLSHIFDANRVFSVSRRDFSSAPILTLEDLFDFGEVVWEGDETEDFGGGMVINREFILHENGEWWASQTGGPVGTNVSGSGEILTFSEYSPSLSPGKLEIIQDKEFTKIRHHTEPGFSQKLLVSSDLNEWSEVSTTRSSRWPGNSYISNSTNSLLLSFRNDELLSQNFYRVVSTPLTFD